MGGGQRPSTNVAVRVPVAIGLVVFALGAGARAIAAGPEPAAVRHARLRTLLVAGLLRDAEAARTVGELARDLRNTLRPAAADVHLFFRGTDARVFVPEVLGELSHLLHLRWSDPCAR